MTRVLYEKVVGILLDYKKGMSQKYGVIDEKEVRDQKKEHTLSTLHNLHWLDYILCGVFNHGLNLRTILIDSKWSLREGRKKEGQLLK